MTRHEINELFQKRSEAWALRDAGALARTHAENGVVRSPMFGELHGREAIAGSYAALFRMFPDWTFHEDALVIDGDQVVQPFSATATHAAEFMGLPATGRKFRIEGMRLHTLKDGFVLAERRIYDFTGLLIQVGVLRASPPSDTIAGHRRFGGS